MQPMGQKEAEQGPISRLVEKRSHRAEKKK